MASYLIRLIDPERGEDRIERQDCRDDDEAFLHAQGLRKGGQTVEVVRGNLMIARIGPLTPARWPSS